jgi:putative flippase GtrA
MWVKNVLLRFIDFFYPPFKRFIGLQTFRYLVCGGSNALLSLIIFHLGYHFLFEKYVLFILGHEVTQYISAYLMALSVSFPVGFCLNKYVVFQASNLQGKTQLIRYATLTATNIF